MKSFQIKMSLYMYSGTRINVFTSEEQERVVLVHLRILIEKISLK